MSPEVQKNTSQQTQYEANRSHETTEWRLGKGDFSDYNLVNPPHYKSLIPEPIDVIHAWKLSFSLGCALKYIARAGRKAGVTAESDLQKAAQYLQFELKRLKDTEP